MTAKYYITGINTFIGSNILSAQSTAVLHSEQWRDFDLSLLVGKLEQSALMMLIGSVAFGSLIWICSILKTCVKLNKPTNNLRKPSLMLLILITGLSTFCGSCSVEQRAMAASYRKVEAAEHRTCPLPHHYQEQVNAPYLNHNPYTGYNNLYGPSFCKYCGRRITR
jgi:hypothetical protein